MPSRRKSSTQQAQASRDEVRSATKRGHASHTEIVRAAIELLGTGGYGALSIGAVCKLANISPTSLYWHFGDKSGLMSAMVRHVQRLDTDIYMSEMSEARTIAEKFDAGMRALRRMVHSDPMNSWVVTSALWEGRHAAPEIVTLVGEARRRRLDYYRDVAVSHFGLERGPTVAHLSAAFSAHAAMSWHQTHDDRELEDILNALRRLWQLAAGWQATPVKDRRNFARLASASAFGYSQLIQGLD